MDPQMQQKCDTKLRELQQNMPFLLKVLERLRNNNLNDPARQTQLEKIQKLYNLLSDKTQTFKWELLIKCENVVNKLQRKMELQGETEFLLRNSVSPIQRKMESTKDTEDKLMRDDIACPESPPPQQEEEYFDKSRQPVVIPTERRSSPPRPVPPPPSSASHQEKHYFDRSRQPVVIPTERCSSPSPSSSSSRNRENTEAGRNHHDEHKDRRHRHSHRRHDHHHHHHNHDRRHHHHRHHDYDQHHHHHSNDKRNSSSYNDNRSFDISRDRSCSSERSNYSSTKSSSIYLERNRDVIVDQYLSSQRKRIEEENNKQQTYRRNDHYNVSPNAYEKHADSPTDRRHNVFSRLGAKVIDMSSDNDDVNNDSFHRITENQSHSTPPPKLTPFNVSKTSPDFLKSPPLTANDITQLLNEANTNSNSNSNSNPNEVLGISEVGTRRSNTPGTSITASKTTSTVSPKDPNDNLDFVRKKFALLTKTETNAAAAAATSASASTSTSSTTSISRDVYFRITPPPPPPPESERVTLNYPQYHSSTSKFPSSSTILPNSNVNVLPTLRPNDPRLRKSNIFTNGNTSSNLLSNNNQSLNLRQGICSPLSNCSAVPSTPSPIYSSTSSSTGGIPLTNQTTKITDPRLQRTNRTNTYNSSEKRQLLVSADSSDENWDVNDNASDIITFPQPRLFPNRNMVAYPVEKIRPTNSTTTILPQRRQSFVWDNIVSPTNKTLLTSNQEEANSFSHSNWHGVSPSNDRFDTFQSNTTNERSNYTTPRTYGAYKELRARAAAEEAARRAAEDAKIQKQSTFDTDQATDLAESTSLSSLNTIYRNSNLIIQDLPKSMESFRIPKKGAVTTTVVADKTIEKSKPEGAVVEKSKPEGAVVEKTVEKASDEKAKRNEKRKDPREEKKSEKPKEKEKEKEKPKEKEREKPKEKEKEKEKEKPKEKKDIPEAETTSKESESVQKSKPIETLKPKPQRERFRDRQKNASKSSQLKKEDPAENIQSIKSQLPGRILKRRATMIDKASAPEIDKEKLLQSNALLFEDLQERERKKDSEMTEIKINVTHRRNKEICFDRTDDGCTVSTQNIISGKRRTRTTANFNEVQQGIAVFKHLKTSEPKKDATPTKPTTTTTKTATTTKTTTPPTQERKKRGPKPKIKPVIKIENVKDEKIEPVTKPVASKVRKRRATLVDTEIKAKIKKEPIETENTNENEEKKTDPAALPNVNSIFDTFIQKILQPSANADELIDKLRDILSEQEIESLLSIREAMMKKNLSDNPPKDVDIPKKNNNKRKIEKTRKSLKSEKATAANIEKETALDDDNDDVNDDDDDDDDDDTENDEIKEGTRQTEAALLRPKAPRRSELDRLHEDIRDMFISEGVLTATGKRMCTFVEPCSTKIQTTTTTTTDVEEKSNSAAITQKPNVPHLRKSRVVLPTLKMTRSSLRKQQLQSQSAQHDSADEESENENENINVHEENSCSNASFSSDTTQVSSATGANFSTVSSVITDITTISSCSFTKSDNEPLVRPMPILKPVKPIRLREEDELDEWLAKQKGTIVTAAAVPAVPSLKSEKSKQLKKRYKPCPKSKKPIATMDDEDDEQNNDGVNNNAKDEHDNPNANKDEETGEQQESKIKTEILDISVPFEDVTSKDTKTTPPKNINPKWHWLSRYAQNCVVCKKKVTFMSPHYKKYHTEHYVSRLAPSILHELRKESTTFNRPILKINIKNRSMKSLLLGQCPFCLQFKHTSSTGWLEHFITHTGEYFYECRLCNKCFNKPAMIEKHMKLKCAELGGRYLHNDEFSRSFKSNEIIAHVCHLCNYLRLGRSSLERHYMEQHDYDVKRINDSIGYKISLIKADDVPRAKTLEEIVEMEKKLNQIHIICLSDDDDDDNDDDTMGGDDRLDIDDTMGGDDRLDIDDTMDDRLNADDTMDDDRLEVDDTLHVDDTFDDEEEKEKEKEEDDDDDDETEVNVDKTKEQTQLIDKDKDEKAKKAASVENAATRKELEEEKEKEITINENEDEIPINSKSTEPQETNEDRTKKMKAKSLAGPISSVFLSTTDDSNDGEAPTVYARKLLTVDNETDICTNRSPKPSLSGSISMAERLSQRLKEAENNLAKQCSKEVSNQQSEKLTSEEETAEPKESQTIDENSEEIQSRKQLESESQTIENDTDEMIIEMLEENSNDMMISETVADDDHDNDNDNDDNSNECETDLIIEEDDDDWEDIEIVETAPVSAVSATTSASSSTTTISSNQNSKELKLQKNKKNRLHNLSRLYATISPASKFTKKSTNFKPLLTIFSNRSNTIEKESKVSESVKETSIDNDETNLPASSTVETITTTTTTTNTTTTTESVSTTSVGVRPMISNLDDLLPDSPCNDPIEIAPELAPSGPLKELNDITSFLGTNLSGLMDMDVEEPAANSVCIHNNDNQQTSIQEALDFVASQGAEYAVESNLNQSSECFNFGFMNRIQNIGFTCADETANPDKTTSPIIAYRFYCFSDRCTFLYSSEAIGLENHFHLEHPHSKWNGYCYTCAKQVKIDTPTFSDEFKHLLDTHIKQQQSSNSQSSNNNDSAAAVATTTTTTKTTTNNNSNSTSITEKQPRLKLRRLSGDCLSSSASLHAESASPCSSTLMENIISDSNSFSDLIHFHPRDAITTHVDENLGENSIIPTSVESLPDDVPYFTNISKDFQITSISSGLEPTEISAIVKSAMSAKAPTRKVDTPPPAQQQQQQQQPLTGTSNFQISNVISLANTITTACTENSTTTTNANQMQYPKITNVCSLNTAATKKIGAIWSQQINEERAELEHSYADSLEVAAILSNNNNNRINYKKSSNRDIDNESPGPMIISETLPTGQTMSGNFVITQTVSAQYTEETTMDGTNKPKLGFNISISSAALENAKNSPTNPKTLTTTAATTTAAAAKTTSKPTMKTSIKQQQQQQQNETKSTDNVEKQSKVIKPSFTCMEKGCKFTTRHLVAMIDHMKCHEQKNDPSEREYLRCSICKMKLSTTDEYTNHIRSEHFSGVKSPALPPQPQPPPPPTTAVVIDGKKNEKNQTSSTPVIAPCALTEKIRNILCQNQVDVTSKEGSMLKDLLKGSTKSVDDENAELKVRVIETVKEIVSKTGICDNDLYRCLVKDCNVKLKEASYHIHVLYHLSTLCVANNTFPCPHCKGKCQNISALKTHIKSHKRHHIFCYVCMETAANDSQMSRHFAQKHWHKKELSKHIFVQEQSNNGNLIPYYVTNFTLLNENHLRDFGKKLVIEWQRKQAATRTHFNPDEVDLLPIQAIFSKEIYCSICLYKTKVRTNMVRHMSQHKNMADTNSIDGGNANNMNHSQGNRKNPYESSVNTMLVSSMDPINPVPCLISNEKHFDRMTNLASSSLGPVVPQGANIPSGGINNNNNCSNNATGASLAVCKLRYTYIPESKRYQCGVPGCQYVTICEDMFRSHLHALHTDERFYQCPFCNEELCKRSLAAEKVVQHLRFHDRTLYQCEICDHSHYIRYVVDRHALEKHGQVQRANILMFVRDVEGCLEGTKKVIVAYGKKKDSKTSSAVSDGNHSAAGGGAYIENIPSNESANSGKDARKCLKYICFLCKHRTITHNQIVAHANSHHGIKKPYQCSYCLTFTEWSEANVQVHINEEHPANLVNVNKIFGKMDAVQMSNMEKNLEEPPRPLWQRDDPTRARQIRGIPMEDEEESEKLRKRLRLSEDYYDDEDDDDGSNESCSVRSRGRTSSSFFLNRFEFGCFHCEFKTKNIDELKSKHWESTHNNDDGLTSKPFLFRLLVRLKCAECQNFTGCFWELQKHMTEDHAKPTSHALDPRTKKIACGYCEYDCNNTMQLLRHHLHDDHQPQDIKGLFSVQMAKVLRLESTSPILYVHCTLCSEIFNSRTTVVQHASEKHAEDTEHFSFRELRNTTIYRCSDCFYTSTDELTTLRHMINHYGRFKRCHFCNLVQSSFNDYMQHCYTEHRAEIKRFSDIYPLNDIKKYLMQILIIFPNGWIINKKNLRHTPYGNEERIKMIYTEICKTSQEPPIPRLSIGRLVARMSIEAKQQIQETTKTKDDIQLSRSISVSSKKQLNAAKISKRRSTFAGDAFQQNGSSKKLKLLVGQTAEIPDKIEHPQSICKSKTEIIPPYSSYYSYYGRKPEKEDWSKLYTKISIAGVNTPISLDKFKLLFKTDAYVLLPKIDIKNYKLPIPSNSSSIENYEDNSRNMHNDYKNVKKACPASQKYRFI